jgi:hypothetical protein
VADTGLPVRFGWFLVPEAADPRGLVEQARLAEPSGSGRPPPRPGEAVEATEEAIALLRLLWGARGAGSRRR